MILLQRHIVPAHALEKEVLFSAENCLDIYKQTKALHFKYRRWAGGVLSLSYVLFCFCFFFEQLFLLYPLICSSFISVFFFRLSWLYYEQSNEYLSAHRTKRLALTQATQKRMLARIRQSHNLHSWHSEDSETPAIRFIIEA